jgi:hypothetical protein
MFMYSVQYLLARLFFFLGHTKPYKTASLPCCKYEVYRCDDVTRTNYKRGRTKASNSSDLKHRKQRPYRELSLDFSGTKEVCNKMPKWCGKVSKKQIPIRSISSIRKKICHSAIFYMSCFVARQLSCLRSETVRTQETFGTVQKAEIK